MRARQGGRSGKAGIIGGQAHFECPAPVIHLLSGAGRESVRVGGGWVLATEVMGCGGEAMRQNAGEVCAAVRGAHGMAREEAAGGGGSLVLALPIRGSRSGTIRPVQPFPESPRIERTGESALREGISEEESRFCVRVTETRQIIEHAVVGVQPALGAGGLVPGRRLPDYFLHFPGREVLPAVCGSLRIPWGCAPGRRELPLPFALLLRTERRMRRRAASDCSAGLLGPYRGDDR